MGEPIHKDFAKIFYSLLLSQVYKYWQILISDTEAHRLRVLGCVPGLFSLYLTLRRSAIVRASLYLTLLRTTLTSAQAITTKNGMQPEAVTGCRR